MRPEYEGAKYYGKNDMSLNWELDKIVLRINSFDSEKVIEDVNEALELYNIVEFIKDGTIINRMQEKLCVKYVDKDSKMISTCAKFFATIVDENFEKVESEVSIMYIEDFWNVINNYKVYKRISNNTFTRYLNKPQTTLWVIMMQKEIVNHFREQIAEVLRTSEQTVQLLVSQHLEHNMSVDYFFPKELKLNEYEKIFQKYVDSREANPNILYLLMISNNTKECPISDKLKLSAKKAYERYFEDNKRAGTGFKFGVGISFRDDDEIVTCERNGQETLYIYDIKWLEENQDHATILNNFIYLFDYFDECWRCNFVSIDSQMGAIEKSIGIKGKKEYPRGAIFSMNCMKSTVQMQGYYFFLKEHGIYLENVVKWFFESYLKDEFGVEDFIINLSGENASWLEKCKNLVSEMDGVLKQFRMFVVDGRIDRELLEISSEHVIFTNMPSFVEMKYGYVNSQELKREMFLLFSDQSHISYTEKTKSKYNTFITLVSTEKMKKSDFYPYQLPQLVWLIDRNIIYINQDGYIQLNQHKIIVLRDMYRHDVICPEYYLNRRPIILEMKDIGDIKFESTLFSKPEAKYMNYILNRAEFSDGKDLRNKYIHSTYPIDEKNQIQDYMELMKIMILIVGKINEEFILRNTSLS